MHPIQLWNNNNTTYLMGYHTIFNTQNVAVTLANCMIILCCPQVKYQEPLHVFILFKELLPGVDTILRIMLSFTVSGWKLGKQHTREISWY